MGFSLAERLRRASPRTGTPLITVGVTSYHDAAVISRCLSSLVDQTLSKDQMEVLVVDDGSSDRTTPLAKSFSTAAQWAGFEVLAHKSTGSPSKGRNTILDSARGTYTFFLDADDYLGPEALRALTRAACAQKADIAVGHYVGVNRSAPNILTPKHAEHPGGYHAGWLNSLHVQKLFRTEFLRGLSYRFNESLIYASDHPFMISAFLHARQVAEVPDTDCYFITLEPGGQNSRGHVSRAEIPAVKQLQFLHDCFGILALARGAGGQRAKLSGRMRIDYWNRLLKLHLPQLVLRKDQNDDAAITALAAQASVLAELYGARTSRVQLIEGSQQMLAALSSQDAAEIYETAQRLRSAAT
ncbi:glycosyltransferase family 2 protein [Nesterenkonia ebinurensis]|uniref:glycosyltransferase family 2 protein n=1 Tax=Nesterenkonia ebinurensis TaxID=2608252 RepID=UPI00123D365C|nr:glycosyltransferase family 2 protein [Nesterenkonia ebinurensis]